MSSIGYHPRFVFDVSVARECGSERLLIAPVVGRFPCSRSGRGCRRAPQWRQHFLNFCLRSTPMAFSICSAALSAVDEVLSWPATHNMWRPKLRRPTLCSGVIAERRLRQRPVITRNADALVGDPETVEWLFWFFNGLKNLGLTAILIVWGLVSLCVLVQFQRTLFG